MFSKPVRKLKKHIGLINPGVPNPRATDIYLVSYPKSGNTWMRYLLTNAIWPDSKMPDLKEMARLIPSYGLENDINSMLDPASPCNQLENRIIKEHFPYNRIARKFVKNVIYLCRDGRDAVISYWYFWNQSTNQNIPLNEFIRMSSKHPYGSWHEHVKKWITAPVNRLVIRYEDMMADTGKCLKDALEFANIRREDEIIQKAVDQSSFGSMRTLEKTGGFNLDIIENVDFVRGGRVGDWENEFNSDSHQLFEKYHGKGITELGYNW